MTRWPAALLALLSLAACGDSFDDAPRQSRASAVSPCQSITFEGTPLTHCVADPAKQRIGVMLDGPNGTPMRSLSALKQVAPHADRIVMAMNGGMFDDAGKPIGYFVERGSRRHKLNRNPGSGNFHMLPNGVFYGSGGQWAVRSTESFAQKVTHRPEFATQSGPMLVIDGKLHSAFAADGESLKIRNAVGVDRAGRAHFVISEAPISFGRLARYFRDGLKTPNALFLDGSVSQLWDPGHERLDALVPLGPLIVVENRANAAR